MGRFKQILFPLALVLAAIAVFEFGARYGASNVRAIAVAAQLQTFLNLYAQTSKDEDRQSVAKIEQIIDNHIATASIQRKHWMLNLRAEPKATLDKTLRNGLTVRGARVLEHLSGDSAQIEKHSVSPEQLATIEAAIEQARQELLN